MPPLPHARCWTPRPLPVGPRLARGWRITDFAAAGAVVRVGRRSSELDRLLRRAGVRHGAFVGAWNPCSRRAPRWRNDAALARLRAVATRRGIAHHDGAGCAARPAWSEDHLLLLGDWRRAMVLAHRFGQHAVVVVRLHDLARLRVLR
ncbi:DUF3293 domain-containing protein [Roseomonas fluvialis]|nr:DUF3293 domain-containing protein [Roseomonas fluvialis]